MLWDEEDSRVVIVQNEKEEDSGNNNPNNNGSYCGMPALCHFAETFTCIISLNLQSEIGKNR